VSSLTFSWVDEALKVGKDRPLVAKDLEGFPSNVLSAEACSAFDNELASREATNVGYATDVNATASNLVGTLLRLHRRGLIRTGGLRLANTLLQTFPPVLLAKLLGLFESRAAAQTAVEAAAGLALDQHWAALKITGLLALALFTKGIVEQQYFFQGTQIGLEVQMALRGAVYSKAQKLSPGARQNTTVGEMTNLMQLDATKVGDFSGSIHTLWDGFLQITLYTTLLFQLLGPSVLVTVGLFALMLPVNKVAFKQLAMLRREGLKHTDARTKLTAELLSGARVVKMMAWEPSFTRRLAFFRDLELSVVKRSAVVQAGLQSLLNLAPTMVFAATLAAFSALGNTLTPSKVFASLALFNQLRFPLLFLPVVLNQCADAKVSVRRLAAFLAADEIQPYVSRTGHGAAPDDDRAAPTASTSGGGHGGNVGGSVGGRGSVASSGRGPSRAPRGTVFLGAGDYTWGRPHARASGAEDDDSTTAAGASAAAAGPASDSGGEVHADSKGGAVKREAFKLSLDRALDIRPGELVCVVGAVGVGKTALLSALLGNMHLEEGPPSSPANPASPAAAGPTAAAGPGAAGGVAPSVVSGRVAYCAQEAWVSSGTVREAIVFGRGELTGLELATQAEPDKVETNRAEPEAGWYERVVSSCELVDDLAGLPGGDRAEVSERGGTLSGGQRHRVALARAVFGRPDVALLDDTLAALDPEVVNRLFDKVLDRRLGLLGGATVVLATNQLQWLPRADRVILLERGEASGGAAGEGSGGARILDQGTYQELLSRGHDLAVLVSRPANETATDAATPAGGEPAPQPQPQPQPEQAGHTVSREGGLAKNDTEAAAVVGAGSAKLVTEEATESGAVSPRVYRAFLASARSPRTVALFVAAAVASQASGVLQQVFLAGWSSDPSLSRLPLVGYLGGLVACAALASFMSFVRAFLAVGFQVRAGTAVHSGLAQTILNAPTGFFDETPSGRLLQRFSKDMDAIDNSLTSGLSSCVTSALSIVGSLATLLLASPVFAPFVPPLAWLYLKIMGIYRPGFRELKRVEGVLRAPVFSHFSESLAGLPTLRAFGPRALERWTQAAHRKVDAAANAFLAQKATDRWLSVRLEFLGNAVALVACALAIRTTFGTVLPPMPPPPSGCAQVLSAASAALFNPDGLAAHLVGLGARAGEECRAYAAAAKVILGQAAAAVATATGASGASGAEVVGAAAGARATLVTAGLAGLAVSNAMAVTGMLQWAVRCFVNVESDMNSMERILQTLEQTPAERTPAERGDPQGGQRRFRWDTPAAAAAAAVGARSAADGQRRGALWDVEGSVEFRSVDLRYRQGAPRALRKLTFSVKPGERVGVVGRSGSGKSTLMAALLRLTEIETTSASGEGEGEGGSGILVDGIDLRDVDLPTLRATIAILPQRNAQTLLLQSKLQPPLHHNPRTFRTV